MNVAEHLKNATSREEGQTIIAQTKYTVKQLKLLAKHLGLSLSSNMKKADLIDKIIEGTIGYRIDSAIIQNHKWNKC